MKDKYIALVDCDSFFVSCEQSQDETLKEKPVCVLSNNDACVIARSKEAKQLGIKMGMPYFMAKKQFPEGIYLSGNMELYKKTSKKIMQILRSFSPDVEVYSIDEAFVELNGLKKTHNKNYLQIVETIKTTIKNELDINVSIGLSKSKVLAKLACEKAKNSGGIYVIGQQKIKNEISKTKIEEIWGIGKNTTILLHKWGILTCKDLIKKDDQWLKTTLGKRGLELKYELMGESIDRVKPKRKLPKSIQNTRSFPKFTSDINYMKNALNIHIHTSCTKLRYLQGKCGAISVMARTKDFVTYVEKISLDEKSDFELTISKKAIKLLEKIYDKNLTYRSCGITLEDLDFSTEDQLTLFNKSENKKDCSKLAKSIDKLESKFGKNIIKTGFFKEFN